LDDRTETLLHLAERNFLLGIWPGTGVPRQHLFLDLHFVGGGVRDSPFQRQVVGDAKEPPMQIRAGAVELQVPEQRQKSLLNDVFGVMHGQAKANHVIGKPRLMLVEQMNNDAFEVYFTTRRGNRACG
jgi:hypothetical protein